MWQTDTRGQDSDPNSTMWQTDTRGQDSDPNSNKYVASDICK